MRPTNFTERKKRLLIFSGLYAASLILLFFIFSAFGIRFTVNDHQPSHLSANALPAAGNEFIQTDSLLHARLRMLQLSDERFRLLADTGSLLQTNEAAMMVSSGERALNNAIDSIETLTTASTDAGRMYKNMINSFRAVVAERLALKNIRSTLASGKTSVSGSQQDMIQWKDLLLRKDNEISRLEMELKTEQNGNIQSVKTSGAGEARKGEIELLQTAFSDQQKAFDALKDNFGKVKTENTLLAAKLADMKKPFAVPAASTNVTDSRVNELEQRLEAMNADLYFARIDCNLARADAQQMISNARQRKELLTESLGMLNNLVKSGDDGVQKKAKEKIARLNRIAITLHD